MHAPPSMTTPGYQISFFRPAAYQTQLSSFWSLLTELHIFPIGSDMKISVSGNILTFQRIDSRFPELNRIEALTQEAFPPHERVPTKEFLRLAGTGMLDFWALYHYEKFAGYMSVLPYKNMAYLSFLAIEAGRRGRGLGSAVLRSLREIYPGRIQIVDLESLDESSDNHTQRIRRKSFYLKNGYRPTGWFLSYDAGTFEILCFGNDFDIAAFQELLSRLQACVPDFHPSFLHTEKDMRP